MAASHVDTDRDDAGRTELLRNILDGSSESIISDLLARGARVDVRATQRSEALTPLSAAMAYGSARCKELVAAAAARQGLAPLAAE